ncbi:MAG TPA: HD domain-containing protein [Candidatus Nitrosotalea sp.]|nr:HD domain-containing protein [Candidatus Nitrosotalea sp.]
MEFQWEMVAKMGSIKKIQEYVRRQVSKNDPAHDFEHIMRVYKNAQRLARKERVKPRLVLAAALLHDIVSYPKSDPRSRNSSVESARKARLVLARHGYSRDEIVEISDAIRDHSFSRDAVPQTLTGKILQDADRLDAIGSIGIARAFSVGGAEGRKFYSNKDPFCTFRAPDDKVWTLDHFYKKLLHLEGKMNTKSARLEARRRAHAMRKFLDELRTEIYP